MIAPPSRGAPSERERKLPCLSAIPSLIVTLLAWFPLVPSLHILVVDDHEDGRGAAASFLADRGFDVNEATNAKSAFDVLVSGPEPSLVILDLMTPVRSAAELLYQMQRSTRLSRIPVIVLNDHRLMPEFRYKMPVAYLDKPYEPEGP